MAYTGPPHTDRRGMREDLSVRNISICCRFVGTGFGFYDSRQYSGSLLRNVGLISLHITEGTRLYRDVDKSLARPGRKQATFPAFYGTWRFITTFTAVHHLSLT